ncbi:hypothetical protein Klosneuvirus_2_255 [Klosneuvirus KNV1]|uniref:Uncharacterized protein n=1 Tax=Klosneuvirus KNV1 TaxID=1977640 RepID=A0A1V0SJC6_9VIRU|nr:hypothetical protein Klosneuvirus_2_255 [Klosneuvirus KNV1]
MDNDLDYGTQSIPVYVNAELDDDFFGTVTQKSDNQENINKLDHGYVYNPFYVGRNNSTVMKMTELELFGKYKRALAFCLKEGIKAEQHILLQVYQNVIKETEMQILTNYFTLVPVSVKMLKNKYHRQTALLIDRPFLVNFNSKNIMLDNDEIIIPLFELDEKIIQLYSLMYESQHDVSTIITGGVLYKYFNCDSYRTIITNRLTQILSDLKDSQYWLNPYNCNINMTTKFSDRRFRIKDIVTPDGKNIIFGDNSKINDKAIKNIFEKINNYDNNLKFKQIYQKQQYTDVSSVVKVEGSTYKLYRINNDPLMITKEQITELFNSITDNKLLFSMFNSLLLSKQYCHLVLNNQTVLDKMKPLFESKLIVLYNYLFGYAWAYMYTEECIVKTRTKNTSRYVFDINTANKLPFFPYCEENILMNPYCVLPVDKKVFGATKNLFGIKMIANYKDYGISTLNDFTTKFNIFTTGKGDKNLFDGLETVEGTTKWKHFAISGSIIPACSQKRSPLMDTITTNEMSYIDKMARYFSEYYNESDIDIMCNSKSIFEFMDNISKLITVIKKNLTSLYGKDAGETVIIEPIKTLGLILNVKFIEECLGDFGKTDDVIKNINSPNIKERLYEEYFNYKRLSNNKYRKEYKNNPLYENFYKISSVDDLNVIVTDYENNKDIQYENDSSTYVYLNDILPNDRKVPQDKNILVLKISESLKFKIKSPHMLHSIEAFRVHYEDYFSCVAKFHLPCVRGYYNGDNVYLLPSCVSALMTFTNIDYKYFAGIRDPIDIINKYRMRGFGTILNEHEKVDAVKYNGTIDKWKDVFQINLQKKDTMTNHFGAKPVTDRMFQPGRNFNNYPEDAYRNPDYEYVNNDEDYRKYFKTKYNYTPGAVDYLKFNAIKEDGSFNPLKKWVIDAAFDELM